MINTKKQMKRNQRKIKEDKKAKNSAAHIPERDLSLPPSNTETNIYNPLRHISLSRSTYTWSFMAGLNIPPSSACAFQGLALPLGRRFSCLAWLGLGGGRRGSLGSGEDRGGFCEGSVRFWSVLRHWKGVWVSVLGCEVLCGSGWCSATIDFQWLWKALVFSWLFCLFKAMQGLYMVL